MKILLAIDSFKGCLSSVEANKAAAEGIRGVCPDAEIVQVPVSDGGEGFIEAFQATAGGELIEVRANDPLMRPIVANYLLKGTTAVIEIAKASGLTLLTEEERNPLIATSYGTGQLVVDALRKGAKQLIVGLGGSATSDAGIGMLQAMIDGLSPQSDRPSKDLPVCNFWHEMPDLTDIGFTIASDVKNPLYGENGAACVFAPQKGATADMVALLDERARRFSEASAQFFGYDRSGMEGAGAAGGLGYAFLQYLDAKPTSGIDLLLDRAGYDELIKGADLVITGEGTADRLTLMGKLPMGILHRSGDVPVCMIAGRVKNRQQLLQAGFSAVECINPPHTRLDVAIQREVAQRNITSTVANLVRDN